MKRIIVLAVLFTLTASVPALAQTGWSPPQGGESQRCGLNADGTTTIVVNGGTCPAQRDYTGSYVPGDKAQTEANYRRTHGIDPVSSAGSSGGGLGFIAGFSLAGLLVAVGFIVFLLRQKRRSPMAPVS